MQKILEYDARLDKCPQVLVNTKLLLKQLNCGEQLTLLLSDPGSKQDIPRLLNKLSISFTQQSISADAIEIVIIKE
ncbi:hypothetical protein A9Q98_00195 [Thalassotalea sp. 42_200_T64]|nr:hypothetical protein A9Q98_00195 [Thalassotalea sp. 42_200_T64]